MGITQVVSGGAADRCGLQVGDKLLGEAAQHLLEAVNNDRVEFTVQQDQHTLLVLQAEEKILQRDYDKVKEEMETPGLREWHAAKSRVDPLDYFLQKYSETNKHGRVWRAKKI